MWTEESKAAADEADAATASSIAVLEDEQFKYDASKLVHQTSAVGIAAKAVTVGKKQKMLEANGGSGLGDGVLFHAAVTVHGTSETPPVTFRASVRSIPATLTKTAFYAVKSHRYQGADIHFLLVHSYFDTGYQNYLCEAKICPVFVPEIGSR